MPLLPMPWDTAMAERRMTTKIPRSFAAGWTMAAILAGLAQAAEPGVQPTLEPVPRPMQLVGSTSPTQTAQRPALADDLAALRAARERLRETQAKGLIAVEPAAVGPAIRTASTANDQQSHRLPGLAIAGGKFTASLRGVAMEEVLAELAGLSGVVIDDANAPGRTRPVTLMVSGLDLDDVLDRLCGAAGLAWRDDPDARTRRIVISAARSAASDAPADRRRAERAYERASAWNPSDRDPAAAAEAAYRRARIEQDGRRNVAAIELYGALVDGFSGSADPAVRRWVQSGIRGIGDCMAALGNYLDARGVYRNYIARAGNDDHELPGVFLVAAAAGEAQASRHADPIARDEAMDDLHMLLERFADEPWAAADVAAARLRLAEMLHAAGRWTEAAIHLGKWREAAGLLIEAMPHRLQILAADCAYGAGRFGEALVIYRRLRLAWAKDGGKPDIATEAYARCALRVGLCLLATASTAPSSAQPHGAVGGSASTGATHASTTATAHASPAPALPPTAAQASRTVEALFAFLRARQDFPRTDLDAELLVAIARCYAELERTDAAVTALWEVLRGDALADRREPSLQLDELVAALVSKLGDHPGPVRARVLFYLAQAAWHQAERDRTQQSVLAGTAMGYYQRVLDESPPAALRHAATIGRARCALVAGQESTALTSLTDLLADPLLSDRDRELAARILGDHHRANGRLREAIKSYRGEVP